MTLPDLAPLIEEKLGRQLRPEEGGSVSDLELIADAYVDECRRLGFLRREFMDFLLTEGERQYSIPFINDVVIAKKSPRGWRRGGLLTPDARREVLVSLGLSAFDGLMRAATVGDWCRIPIDPQKPRSEQLDAGGPARAIPQANYRFKAPPDTRRLFPGTYSTEPVTDLPVAGRRWIALQMVIAANNRGWPKPHEQPRQVLARLFPDVAQPHPDALIAMRAWLEEERRIGPAGDMDVPGFRGPDAWYAGELPG